MSQNFVVSARKYRPQTFGEMLGQEAICHTLQSAIRQGKIAHAYLFCGPRGVGKTSAARIFARTINCEHLTPEGEACGSCPSCLATLEQRSFNVYELDAASNNSADDIRRLNEEVYVKPQYGRYKVYIIDEVHMLSTSAFNAFLKTLEEPPEYVVFVLATTEKNKVLPTILSRCQVYDFKPIPPQQISTQLQHVADSEGLRYDQRALDTIARQADGGMRDALSLFDRLASTAQDGVITYEQTLQVLNILDDEYFFLFTTHLYSGQYTKALLLLDELLAKGVSSRQVVTGLAEFMRSLLVAQRPETLSLFPYTRQEGERFAQMAQQIHPAFLYKSISKLVACERSYRTSQAKRLLVELTLMSIAEMCGAFKVAPTTPATPPAPQAPDRTSEVKKKVAPQPTAANEPANIPPPPQPQKKTPSQPQKYSSPIRIRQIQEEVRQQQKADAETAQAAEERQMLDEPVDQTAVLSAWYAFAKEQLNHEVHIQQIMHLCPPQLRPPHDIVVPLLSQTQASNFAELGDRLVRWIRQDLRNDYMNIVVEIQDTPQNLRPTTTEERASYFYDNYPAAAALIDKLKLRPI